MIKKFIYCGAEYATEKDIRKAIFDQERKVFNKAPTENVVEFWAKFGVTYIEEQEPIENLRTWKCRAIKTAFLLWREKQATLVSSLGFKVDSNERAMSDVSGLLIAYEEYQNDLITFRDANNAFHSLTYAEVKVLQKEIIANGNYAYEQKWLFDAQVESATSKEELEAIQIVFVGKDFSVGVTNDV